MRQYYIPAHILNVLLSVSFCGGSSAFRGTLGAFIEGAVDTTAVFLRSLILILVAFPEAQLRAQKEIDTIVGVDRGPLPSDFEQLPYVQAIVKEVSQLSVPFCYRY